MLTRPPPPDDDGREYTAVADGGWRLVRPDHSVARPRRCRQPRCGAEAVAELARRTTLYRRGGIDVLRWWAYCGDHLYGRWIENGQVMRWSVVPPSLDSAGVEGR